MEIEVTRVAVGPRQTASAASNEKYNIPDRQFFSY